LFGLAKFLNDTKAALHEHLASAPPWMEKFLSGTLDFIFAPLTEPTGRFPLLALVAGVTIAFIAFTLGMRTEPGRRLAGFFRFCFPKGLYTHPSTLVDWQVAFANNFLGSSFNITWRITGALLAGAMVKLLVLGFGPATHTFVWTAPAIIGFSLLASLSDDLGYFFFHWTCHVVPALWAFHKVHHSAEVMTPLTAARVHPLERAILGVFRAVATSLVLAPALYFFTGSASVATIFGFSIFGSLFNILGHVLHHSHIWVYFGPVIGRVIVSPAQHQIHHSTAREHWDRNFAENWSIWDTLFGTLYLPKGRETLTFGLTDLPRQPHGNVVTAYLVPFWESGQKILAPIGALLRPLSRSKQEG
jgi:sterol desaturase/sphingolipid hydroxylase (fatty acid hydroxylase superfamily)